MGYAGFKENFTSRVHCDQKLGIVEAVSGDAMLPAKGAIRDEGVFESLRTKWSLDSKDKDETDVDFEIEVKFKSGIYSAMMQAASPQVAGLVIRAFEKRVEKVVKDEAASK